MPVRVSSLTLNDVWDSRQLVRAVMYHSTLANGSYPGIYPALLTEMEPDDWDVAVSDTHVVDFFRRLWRGERYAWVTAVVTLQRQQ